jgi:hypothetical protein
VSELNNRLVKAVEVIDILELFSSYKITQSMIAQITGASERSVRNWKKTSAIRPLYEERLRELQQIVVILSESLTPRGVSQWLRAKNRMLNNERPVMILSQGNATSVLQVAKAYRDGAYI